MTKKIKDKLSNLSGKNLIDEIIKKHQIDTNVWYVDSFKIKDGSWDTSALKRDQDLTWTKGIGKKGDDNQIMEGYSKRFPEFIVHDNKTYSIEITFKRLKGTEGIDIKKVMFSFIKKIPKFPYKTTIPLFKTETGIALEMAPFDVHLGKLANLAETGYRNYDLNIAVKDFLYTTNELLNWAKPFAPEKIFYIIGQDLFHMDNMQSRTSGGDHTLDVDGRITKVNDKVFEAVTKSIYDCRAVAPVKIIWSPGNHDFLMSYMLCFALKQHFKDDPFVEVDISKTVRKAELWGTLLVGWTHRITGRYNTWANELAQAFPELWAKSKFREWHHGDQHKKQNAKLVPTFTSGGVICRQLTALSPVDKWHYENLYTDAIPGGEAFLWSKTKGVFANFTAWTGQYEDNRDKLIEDVD